MKILAVSSVFPSPPNTGDRNRIFHFLKQLSRGHEVDLVTAFRARRNDAGEIGVLKSFCRSVRLVRVGELGMYARAAGALLGKVSVVKGSYPEGRFRQAVREARASARHDAAFVYQLRAAAALPELADLPVVTDFTDCLHLLFEEYARQARGTVKAPLYRREGRKLRRYERFVGAHSFASVVTAEADARGLADAGVANAVVVQNGVEIPETVTEPRRPAALFIGDPAYPPNREAVEFIADEIWPLVLRERPDAVVHFVGQRRPAVEKRFAGRRGLVFTGPVRDLAAAYGAVSVCLVPIFTGTGIKNKLLEGLAHGRVVIATHKAAAGLPLSAGRELFIANTPEDFARLTLEAFQKPDICADMRRLGREAMIRDFSWEAKTRDLETVLMKACQIRGQH